MRQTFIMLFSFISLCSISFAEVSPQIPYLNGLSTNVDGVCGDCRHVSTHSDNELIYKKTLVNRISEQRTIIPHCGQTIYDADADLSYEGRDRYTSLAILRRHISRTDQSHSIFGPCWSFNWQWILEENEDGSLSVFRFSHKTNFFLNGVENFWEAKSGCFDTLRFDGDAICTLRRPCGLQVTFHVETNSNGRLVGHAVSFQSPNEKNVIKITYDTDLSVELKQRKILSITESYGRTIEFFYEDTDFVYGVSRIRDFSGREVIYDYNTEGQLVSVRSPLVLETGIKDFPDGQLTQYRYLNHSDPLIKNALTQVIDPNQSVSSQEPRLAWDYEIDAESPFFGYVRSHTLGNTSVPDEQRAGGSYTYDYDVLSSVEEINTPSIRLVTVDRRGTTTHCDFNYLGHLLNEAIFTQEIRDQEPISRSRQFTYNNEGDLVSLTREMGAQQSHTIIIPVHYPRNAYGCDWAQEITPDSRGGDQNSLGKRIIYEPIFNRPFKEIYEDGHEMVYRYDYMENLARTKSIFSLQLGLSEDELQTIFDELGITSLGDANSDGLTNQAWGNVIKIEYPTVTLPSQAQLIGLEQQQEASEVFRYNAFNQLIYHKDAEANVTLQSYLGADDPDGNGIIDVAGESQSEGGYLSRVVRDALSDPARNSGTNPIPVVQSMSYEYTAQASIPENVRGYPTAIIDGQGVTTHYFINDLDQIIKVVRAADVSRSGEGYVAYGYDEIIIHDHNNNVIEKRVRHKDNHSQDDDYIVSQYFYDILDQMKEEIFDVGENRLNIQNSFSYDESQNLIENSLAVGTSENTVERFLYDERDFIYKQTKAFGTTDSSLIKNEIDDNGNVIKKFFPNSQSYVTHLYDGFDRLKEVIQPSGAKRILFYDSLSHLVTDKFFGRGFLTDPTEMLLAQTDYLYDARGRQYRMDRHLFHYEGQEIGALDDGLLDPGDGKVSTIFILDKLGRVIAQVGNNNQVTEFFYDGLSRKIKESDAEGNHIERRFDQNGNVTHLIHTENSPLIATTEKFLTTYTYDSLNRLIEQREHNGQTIVFAYDSHDNLIKSTDPLGNHIDYLYNRMQRELIKKIYLSRNGMMACLQNRDDEQGGGDGVVTIRKAYNALGQLIAQTDDNQNTTRYFYNKRGQVERIECADGTSENWTYSSDGLLHTMTDQNQSVQTWSYDFDRRPVQVDIDNTQALSTVIGTTKQTWVRDGLGRVLESTDEGDEQEKVIQRFTYNSLNKLRETQLIGERQELSIDTLWQGDSRQMSHSYPDGRLVCRSYDALNRLSDIREQSPSGDVIASFNYVGPSRDVLISYGNRMVLDRRNQSKTQSVSGQDAGYDNLARPIRLGWNRTDGPHVMTYLGKYNGVGGIGTNQLIAEAFYMDDETVAQGKTIRLDSALIGHTGCVVIFTLELTETYSRPIWVGRTLDGVGKMTAFEDIEDGQLIDRQPIVDGDPVEAGFNQYSSFDGRVHIYSHNGNLEDNGIFKYLYDFDNRLREVRFSNTNELVVSYLYDAMGRCVLRQTDQQVERFIYNDWRLFEVRAGDDTVLRQFVDGRDDHIDEHIQIKTNGQHYFYHATLTGSVGFITDESADLVESYRYDFLGEPKIYDQEGTELSESLVGNRYMVQGRFYDHHSQLYYFRKRYYSHELGEFITRHPTDIYSGGRGNPYFSFGLNTFNLKCPMGTEIK